jgi:addiction module RelB/DinJ family antitoxin
LATISSRVDDALKTQADIVAENIGISLSSAINIFLKRFVAEGGFPFEVKAINYNVNSLTDQEILKLAQLGVQKGESVPTLPASLYMDSQTEAPKITN